MVPPPPDYDPNWVVLDLYPYLSSDGTAARQTDQLARIAVTNGVFNINLTLADPDADSDLCPDWWEVFHFGSITNWNGSGDPDSDGLVNSNEYIKATNPMNWDTDGDGTRDGDDLYPLDPNYPPNASGTITYTGYGAMVFGGVPLRVAWGTR